MAGSHPASSFRFRVTPGLAVFLSALLVYLLSLNSLWATDHTTSFLQLDWSILAHHSFVLGSGSSFKPNSVDDFELNGNYYSALDPGTAILALPFAAIGFALDGHFTVFGYALTMSEAFVALANAVAAYMVYAVGRFFFSKKTSALLAFAYAFSTVSWPFATFFFQSDVSAMFDLLAVYFAIKVTRDGGRLRDALLSGASVAAALTTDYVNLIFVPILAVYLILAFRRPGKRFVPLAFLLASMVGVILVGLYNEAILGTAFHTTEQAYLGSPTPFGEFSNPIYLGIYLNLLSPLRGLFVFSPFLLLGALGFHDMLREMRHRPEVLLLLACFLGIFLPYSAWYDPTGGAAFGPRFLVSAIPFLLLPAGSIVESATKSAQRVAYVLYAAGVVVNGIGGLTSALAPTSNWGLSPLLDWTLPTFLRGGIDVWWLSFVGMYWPIPAVALLLLALALPIISERFNSSMPMTDGHHEAPLPGLRPQVRRRERWLKLLEAALAEQD